MATTLASMRGAPRSSRLSRRAALGLGAAALAAPSVARARSLRWRLVTSWPKNRIGPGVSARRIAERIGALSGGRLEVDLFAAGGIVSPFPGLDAVSKGTGEMGDRKRTRLHSTHPQI